MLCTFSCYSSSSSLCAIGLGFLFVFIFIVACYVRSPPSSCSRSNAAFDFLCSSASVQLQFISSNFVKRMSCVISSSYPSSLFPPLLLTLLIPHPPILPLLILPWAPPPFPLLLMHLLTPPPPALSPPSSSPRLPLPVRPPLPVLCLLASGCDSHLPWSTFVICPVANLTSDECSLRCSHPESTLSAVYIDSIALTTVSPCQPTTYLPADAASHATR